jgi:uncharacterized protein
LSDFAKAIAEGYATEGAAIELGRGVHEGELHQDAVVRIPLAMMNRHGLVAGATGTGKTRTLQLLAEQLSAAGVPVFAADVKGDLSGLAQPGEAGKAAEKRQAELGLPFAPTGFPTEYLALGTASAGGLVTGKPRGAGVPVRATISDFGPQLLAKVLSANKTQEQSLTLVFHHADENGLPLVDLSDLRALLTFLDSDKPKLVFFVDEAHLLFDGATDAFLDSVAQTVRLIRSKGVGIFFVTQNPQDRGVPTRSCTRG